MLIPYLAEVSAMIQIDSAGELIGLAHPVEMIVR